MSGKKGAFSAYAVASQLAYVNLAPLLLFNEGGHYVSYVCGDGDEWWELNDSRVARVDGKDLLIRARGRGSVSVQWSLIINRMTARTSCCTRGTPSKPCPVSPNPLRRRFPSCWGTPNSGTC